MKKKLKLQATKTIENHKVLIENFTDVFHFIKIKSKKVGVAIIDKVIQQNKLQSHLHLNKKTAETINWIHLYIPNNSFSSLQQKTKVQKNYLCLILNSVRFIDFFA